MKRRSFPLSSDNYRRPAVGLAGSILAAALLLAVHAWALDPGALPVGGRITAGQGRIDTSGAAMTVTQDTRRMVADWDRFDIGANASVTFAQPDAASVALNRIHDTAPSQIFGRLAANGQVFLLNPAGVIFGPTARVDVGGLVASSLSLSNEDFMAGNAVFAGGATGTILNRGYLRAAEGGYIAFVGPAVVNEGTIVTPGGTTALAAGDKVSLDFTGDRLVTFTVDRGAVDALAANKGLIRADGGLVAMTAAAVDELTRAVVNNDGVIEARSLAEKNGRVVLTARGAGGDVHISGRIDVSGTVDPSTGGTLVATAATVTLDGGATIDARGGAGGGEIYIGGGWQGSDPAIANARRVSADDSVAVYADALDRGDGGTVVFWSDDETRFAGHISLRGGALGGDGGQAEVSGKHFLAYSGITDARAPAGRTGDLLLDPDSIDIVDGGTGAGAITGSTVYEKDLEAQLANITLQSSGGWGNYVRLNDLTTDGVITLQDNISLTITAGDYFAAQYCTYETVDVNDEIRASGSGAITIRAALSLSSGKLTSDSGKIKLWGDNGLTVGNTITTNGGDVELWADSDNLGGGQLILNQTVTTNGGDVDLDAGTAGVIVNAPVSTGAGRLYFDRLGTVRNATYRVSAKLSATGDIDLNQNLQFGAGAEIETTGALTISGTSTMQNSSATLILTASAFDFQQDVTGNGASVTVRPYNAATNVDIGAAGAGDMTFNAANFSRLSGFANVTVGRSDGTGTTRVVDNTSVSTSGYLELANQTVEVTGGTLANTGGDIILSGGTFSVSQSITAKGGTGKVTLRQLTAADPIAVGSGITTAVLDRISAGTLEIGRTDGGDVTVDSDITTSVDALNVLSGGNITLASGATLDVGTGTAALAAAGNFINNGGADAIRTSGDGRWLIYSATPAADTFGGLASGNAAIWNKTWAGYPPATVAETGNRYLFSTQPALTVTAADRTKTYVQTVNLDNPVAGTDYSLTGLVDASAYGNVFTQDAPTGSPAISSAGAAAGAAVAGSPYAITAAAGTFAAPAGYGATIYTAGSLTVNKAPLSVTATDDRKVEDGTPYEGGNGVVYAGFADGESEAVLGGTLTYGGNSQQAVDAGTYDITPSGLNADNYTITFVDGALTIAPEPVTDVVPENLLSPQEALNGTQLDPAGGGGDPAIPNLGPGAGSASLADLSNASLVGAPPPASGTVLASPRFAAEVRFDSTANGDTRTLQLGNGVSEAPMQDVGSLPLFHQRGQSPPMSEGSLVVREGPSSISVTRAAAGIDVTPVETGSDDSPPLAFTLSSPDGRTVSLNAAVSAEGLLVIDIPDSAAGLDPSQAVLMAMAVVKNEHGTPLASLRGVLMRRR